MEISGPGCESPFPVWVRPTRQKNSLTNMVFSSAKSSSTSPPWNKAVHGIEIFSNFLCEAILDF
jgi:hypothetical protein